MSAPYSPEEPVVAIATALAPAAMGIVRASGKDSVLLASKIFSRPKALLTASASSMVYGWLFDPVSKKRVDEVMIGVHKAPRSFTGEDMVEVFCHGGVSIVKAVLELFLNNGFRQAERGEFTFRAYINGKADLTRAEAVREIIDSKTSSSRDRALDRLSGGLYSALDSIKKLLIDTLASIEVEIEYPEDEETIQDSFDSLNLSKAQDALSVLASSWQSEKLFQDGARVVLCGKTNAGKSSLFNALLKEERAIVSNVEGTTRDWLESYVDFAGIPVRLFDTAGLRETSDIVESVGVERSVELSKEADVILYLVDSTAGLTKDDEDFLSNASNAQKSSIVLVWNKSDSPQSLPLPSREKEGLFYVAVPVSAKKVEGIQELVSAVRNLLFSERSISFSSKDSSVALGSKRQYKCVAEALERVRHAIGVYKEGYSLDAVVQDLEDALTSLGEVTGEVTPDDVLGSIFSRFCVGK